MMFVSILLLWEGILFIFGLEYKILELLTIKGDFKEGLAFGTKAGNEDV